MRKGIDVDVKVYSTINVTAVCEECGEELTIKEINRFMVPEDDRITIEVAVHKCESIE